MANAETKKFYEDIIIEANHALAYWARGEIVDGVQWIWDMEEPEEKWKLDAEVVEKGIERIVSDPDFRLRQDIKNQIFAANLDKDAIHLDADGVDYIVQAGIFGEAVYG